MESNTEREETGKINKIRAFGLAASALCTIAFFSLLAESHHIVGYALASYPVVLGLGLFFGAMALSGSTRNAINCLLPILILGFGVVIIGLLLGR